jgi:5'(3')-deoxyribonucleotidase
MYLENLKKTLSDYEIYMIEESKAFSTFLEKFWVHWILEYFSFSDEEKMICLEEYLRRN